MFDVDLSALVSSADDTPTKKPRTSKPSLRTNEGQIERLNEIATAVADNDLDKVSKLSKGWTLNKNDGMLGAFTTLVDKVATAEQLDAVLGVRPAFVPGRDPLAIPVTKAALRTRNTPLIRKDITGSASCINGDDPKGIIAVLDAVVAESASTRFVDNIIKRVMGDGGSLPVAAAVLQHIAGLPGDYGKLSKHKVAMDSITMLVTQDAYLPTTNESIKQVAAAVRTLRSVAVQSRRKTPYYLRDEVPAGATRSDAADMLAEVGYMMQGKPFDVNRVTGLALLAQNGIPALAARFEKEPALRDKANFSSLKINSTATAKTIESLGLVDRVKAVPMAELVRLNNIPTRSQHENSLIGWLHRIGHPDAQAQSSFELSPHLCTSYKPEVPYLLNNIAWYNLGNVEHIPVTTQAFLASEHVKVDVNNFSLVEDVATMITNNGPGSSVYGRRAHLVAIPLQASLPPNFDRLLNSSGRNLLSAGHYAAQLLLKLGQKGDLPAHKLQSMLNHQDTYGSTVLHGPIMDTVLVGLRGAGKLAGLDASIAARTLNKAGQLPYSLDGADPVFKAQTDWLLEQGAVKVTPISRGAVLTASQPTERLVLTVTNGQGKPFSSAARLPGEASYTSDAKRNNPLIRPMGHTSVNPDGSFNVRVKSLNEAEKAVKELAQWLVVNELLATQGKAGEFMPEGWVAAQEVQQKPRLKDLER